MGTSFSPFDYLVWQRLLAQGLRVLVIALLFEVLVRLVNWRLERYLKPALANDLGRDGAWRLKRRAKLRAVTKGGARAVLYTVALLYILDSFGVPLLPVYVVGGALTLAATIIGRDLLRDILSGCALLAEDQFAVGDRVAISWGSEGNDIVGTVEHFTLRATSVREEGVDRVHVIPNRCVTHVVARRKTVSADVLSAEPQPELARRS